MPDLPSGYRILFTHAASQPVPHSKGVFYWVTKHSEELVRKLAGLERIKETKHGDDS